MSAPEYQIKADIVREDSKDGNADISITGKVDGRFLFDIVNLVLTEAKVVGTTIHMSIDPTEHE